MKFSESAYYSSEHGLYHNHCQAMGTRLDMIFQGVEEDLASQAFEKAYRIVCDLESELSRYKDSSSVSMVNLLASKQNVVLNEQVFEVLALCSDFHERTDGLFDIGLGKITHAIRGGNQDPESIPAMLNDSGMKNVRLDPEKRSVKFLSSQVEIDLGGFGKGYALEKVKSLLTSMDISNAFISFGDSSIQALGNHPHGSGWKSGINHQFKPGESVFEILLNDESLSTSGTVPGNAGKGRQGHVLHPGRGLTGSGIQHVSVVSLQATEAEVLSTAMMAASEEEKIVLLRQFPASRAVTVAYNDEGLALLKKHNFNDQQK